MSQLIQLSTRKWRALIGFPFGTIEQISAQLSELYIQRDHLKALAADLIEQWNSEFPRSTVPVYLTRVSDKSFSTLRWRLSATHSTKASQVSFGPNMLDYFHVQEHREIVCRFESRRQDIDLHLSLVLYEILRLESYQTNTRLLVEMKKGDSLKTS